MTVPGAITLKGELVGEAGADAPGKDSSLASECIGVTWDSEISLEG